ncbi:MAG: hypothetical protein ACHQ0I_05250, partial [Candidatus Lutacidiplasmatales archaeon]
AERDPEPYDPVGHLYPPLVGPTGREYHGPEFEHHQATIDHHRSLAGGRTDGPMRRPERLYLHYLLLHMDRLSNSALRYLRTTLDEEMDHRKSEADPSPAATAEPTAPDQPAAPGG